MLKKLENWIFYIFLFLIPISIRHIFNYEPFNFVEWTAIYLYATDILLLVLLILWCYERSRSPKTNVRSRVGEIEQKIQQNFYSVRLGLRLSDYFLLAFVVVAGLSISNALDVPTAVFQWFKLVEGMALYFYVKEYALKRFELKHAFEAIVLGGVFQAVIAIGQFMNQGSLGLKYLGESPLAPALTGIAAFLVDGVKIVRAYGTTPHSNVLALFLFVALGAFYSIAIYQKRDWWWHIFHVLILWAFLLTFSRVIIGLWVLVFLVRVFLIRFYPRFHQEFWQNLEMRRRSLKIFWITIIIGVVFTVCYWPYVVNRSIISSTDEAVQLRVLYNNQSLAGDYNLLGHGIGNFVPWLMTQDLHLNREVYQPVHNIYLLVYSETGIIGAVLFLLFIFSVIYEFYKRTGFKKLYHFSFGLVILSILIFGLFDHYLWTIQSGRLLFFLGLGLLAGPEPHLQQDE